MATARVRARGQITLPREIREAAFIEEGDRIDFELTDDGVLLRVKKDIDASQAWFWTPEWQAGEREAEADIKAGRTKVYTSDEEFLAALRGRRDADA